MNEKWTIQLKRWNRDTQQEDNIGEVSISDIVHSMTDENVVYLISEWLNVGMKDQGNGLKIGKAFHSEHRTLQASLFRWCLGIIVGLSEQQYTDARNETAITNAKKIAELLRNNSLEMGRMI